MNENESHPLEGLHRDREDLRSRLAKAWELREPLEQIRVIEDQLRSLWSQIETAETQSLTHEIKDTATGRQNRER